MGIGEGSSAVKNAGHPVGCPASSGEERRSLLLLGCRG